MDKQNRSDSKRPNSDSNSGRSPANGESNSAQELPEGWREAPKEKEIPGALELVYLPKSIEASTYKFLSLVGFGLLGLALFEALNVLLPFRFTDAAWEFRLLGKMVDIVPVPLIGMLLVFLRRESYIRKVEMRILWFLSWLCLVIGIFYFLLVPLGIINTMRINDQSQAQVNAQLSNQNKLMKQAREQVTDANEQQLINMLTSSDRQSRAPKIDNVETFKSQLLYKLAESEKATQQQAENLKNSQRIELIKNSLKWNFGALLAGVLFVWIWRLTLWARASVVL